jgi:hypothetical protein
MQTLAHLNEVKGMLLEGLWCFSSLLQPYHEQISSAILAKKSLSAENIPTSQLSLLLYSALPMDELALAFSSPSRMLHFNNNCNSRVREFLGGLFSAHSPQIFKQSGAEDGINVQELTSALASYSPQLEKGFRALDIRFFVSNTGDFFGASHPKAIGIVAVGFRFETLSFQFQLRSIVHEMAHQELFLVNLLDRIILPGNEFHVAYAPLQKKERPLIGRIHSAHALFRMAQFEKRLNLQCESPSVHLLMQTIQTIPLHGLTDFGRFLVTEIYEKSI